MIRYKREAAQRVFAQEFGESDLYFKEGDDPYAPNYLLTPTGAKCNRIFAVGRLTESEEISDNYWMARVADPTGIFLIYAGQYQEGVVEALSALSPSEFVAVIGKPKVYESDFGMGVSVRPEYINVVDSDTRDLWIVDTAKQTMDRIRTLEERDEGKKAREHYSTDSNYYIEMILGVVKSLEDEHGHL
jgi:hypothetical protein